MNTFCLFSSFSYRFDKFYFINFCAFGGHLQTGHIFPISKIMYSDKVKIKPLSNTAHAQHVSCETLHTW